MKQFQYEVTIHPKNNAATIGCTRLTIPEWERMGLRLAAKYKISDAEVDHYRSIIEAAIGRELELTFAPTPTWVVVFHNGGALACYSEKSPYIHTNGYGYDFVDDDEGPRSPEWIKGFSAKDKSDYKGAYRIVAVVRYEDSLYAGL